MNLIDLHVQETTGEIKLLKINPKYLISIKEFKPYMSEYNKQRSVQSAVLIDSRSDSENYLCIESIEEIEKLIKKATAGGANA